MHVLIFGATGMVGQGVLRECLLAPDVERVVVVGRSPLGRRADLRYGALREVVLRDLSDTSALAGSPLADEVAALDACFFCLGVSAAGMSEAEYTALTYDLALAVATWLAERNPRMTFVYVSGAGTDSTEQGRTTWARVKGRTENALLRLPFAAAYMFRPGLIQPLHGITSRTAVYRWAYVALAPLLPLLRRVAPNAITTTERVGRAMLAVARRGYPTRILEQADINGASVER